MNQDILAMQTKMSKSKPGSAIVVNDSPDEIRKKIRKATCPPNTDYTQNPILNWMKYLVFYDPGMAIEIPRKIEHGGPVFCFSYEDVEAFYLAGELHPMDLKNFLADWLIKKLEPIRTAFEEPKLKAALERVEAVLAQQKKK